MKRSASEPGLRALKQQVFKMAKQQVFKMADADNIREVPESSILPQFLLLQENFEHFDLSDS